jgi:NADPH:quinone reductase-like Zn-dependent oxidoreductase
MTSMKAVRIHNYGGADALIYEDAPRPAPGAGEVLVRVLATSVNPVDSAIRAGYMAGYFNLTMPAILGLDVSGVIEEAGAGVTAFQRGDNVYTRTALGRDGAFAEYVAVSAEDVVTKPQSLDHIHAAALPHVFLTAWQALVETAELSAGQTVLIHGASGGVGHVAVQLAKARGAKVIGTTSRNVDFVRDLGVDEVIDYAAAPFETAVHDVDVVLDTVGGETQQRSWGVLKPGGILVSLVQPPSADTAAAYGVRGAMVFGSPPVGKVLTELAALVDAGQVKPRIAAVLPLAEIRQATAMIESGHTAGKIVLEVAR